TQACLEDSGFLSLHLSASQQPSKPHTRSSGHRVSTLQLSLPPEKFLSVPVTASSSSPLWAVGSKPVAVPRFTWITAPLSSCTLISPRALKVVHSLHS